jgi:1-phosphofructokinase family hexose kinase
MILTVTINPLLERRFYYPQIDLSSVNRNGKVILKAGGKGINVNRQLNKFGLNNLALLFSGGNNGKLLRESLRNEKINFSGFSIKNETRDAAVIIDQSKNKIYSFFKSDTKVSTSEVESFILKLGKMIPTCELVVFSGSSPCKETDIIFPEGIRIANKHDKVSICDTYGTHLKDCLTASPTIIHNNSDEIQSSLDVNLESEKENLLMLNSFYKKGIKQAFITNAENPFYASNFDFHYKVSLPKIDTVDSTGSGDAFTAGLIYGWHNRLNYVEQLRFASALGVCNAQSFEVCEIEIERACQMIEDININQVGKKIKKINDMPG